MKTTFRFIIAATAAIAVFSSCQKELSNETANNTTDGVRTISVQFDNSTKASLSGFTPSFTNGDKIRVSNTEKSEECTVSVDGSGSATFSTTLSGTLTAIYPADAAVYTSGTPDGLITSFKVLASQDGDIAKAIIAKATVETGSSSATFNVQTALFEITPPDGVKSFTVTSLKTVVSGARTGNAIAINTVGATDADKLVITVSNDNLSTFYVALVPGLNLTDLSFEYITDATKGLGAMKGIPMKDITAANKNNATAANTKYTIDGNNWHPYVKIGNKKWATENVGATETDSYGTYFAWGDVTGQTTMESGAFTTDFDWAHAPFNDGQSTYDGEYFISVRNTVCPNDVLALENDAAYANWGGPWRLPSAGEFKAMVDDTDDVWVTEGGVNGRKFTEAGSSNVLFFPAAGRGSGGFIGSAGDTGFYWSGTLYSTAAHFACDLYFHSGTVNPADGSQRCLGFPVRPVSD